MPEQQTKIMILGADAPIVPRVRKYLDEGEMPNLKGLIDAGVFAANCLVPFPTITPPNWATIVTGAWPGTHGVTCFHTHKPGRPLDEVAPAFDSTDVHAEFLWEAAARAGKRSIVLNYPTSWPPRGGELLTQVAGPGLAPNEWREHPRRASAWDTAADLCAAQLFAEEEYPRAAAVQPRPPSGWASAPDGALAEYELRLTFPSSLNPMDPLTWWALILATPHGPRLSVYASKQSPSPMCTLAVGEWSPKTEWQFTGEAGPRRGVFKFKLLELAPDGSGLKLFLTPICALDGYHHPAGVAEELAALGPMPLPTFGVDELLLEWIDDATFLDLLWEGHNWLGAAADALLSGRPWDLFVMHLHAPDWVYHGWATRLDPLTEPDARVRARFEALERELHRAWDAMLGIVLAHADDATLVAVVSDHGAKASGRHVPVGKILIDAGLLTVEQTAAGASRVAWDKTRAFAQRSCYVYVNLEGRDPDGIVPPAEYEATRDAILEALLSYRDPDLGLCPFSMACRREDARPLGIYGDCAGDIIFAVRGEFDGQHGDHLPTTTWGIGDIHALLVLTGPGVLRGATMQRTAWITDLVPTLCYLAEWPMPHEAEGAVLWQAMQSPDEKTDELRRLRRNYRRLKQAHDADTALTHSYHDLTAEALEAADNRASAPSPAPEAT
jgi:predicted AlkP superfamily phosphohydrolase/phosphomutase